MNLARTLRAVVPLRATAPIGVRRVLAAIASESGLDRWTIASYRLRARGARGRRGPSKRRIYALTGSIGGRVRGGGRIISVIATADSGEIIHLRRVHSR